MQLANLKILIVEDEPAHVAAFQRSLENATAHITLMVASTLLEYRERVDLFQPDIVLLDINLPDGRAIEVLTSPPEMGAFPILVMTSYGDEQTAVEALKAGALDYLVKSTESFATIPRKVAHTLREWHLLKQRQLAEKKLRRSEQILQRTGKMAKIGGWELELSTMAVTWSEEVYRIHEVAIDTVVTLEEAINFYAPDARLIIEKAVKSGAENGTPWDLELPLITASGNNIWVRVQGIAEMQAGKPVCLMGICQDITDRKQAEQQLNIAATTFEVQEGIIVTDRNRIILRVNKAFKRLTGFSAEEVVGNDYGILGSIQQGSKCDEDIWEVVAADNNWQGEVWSRNKQNQTYPQWLTINAVADSDENITNYVISFSDITEHKEAEEQIRQLAFYDGLTELPNRRILSDRLQHSFALSSRHNSHCAVLFIDLDNFKNLNDTKGHDVGDLLLIEVAQRLLTCVRENDTVTRLGGDEFVVILEDLHHELNSATSQAKKVAKKMLRRIKEPYLLRDFEYHTTASIGICHFKGHEHSEDEILKRADSAMYQAKHSGRNALRFFDPVMQAELEARTLLEADMRRAIVQHQFKLFYQVQVDHEHRIIGAEVLLRWYHPSRGEISPMQFIPLAEETELIVPIGYQVLEMACAQIKGWESRPVFQDISVAVNISARQFRHPTFISQVRKVLETSAINPQRLKLELTESVVHENVPNTIAKMHELKTFGIDFSMDDFGTGYSSLSYLKLLPLKQLKIDKSFVRDIKVDNNDAVIIKTILAMAKSLGLDAIAEGVETEEQRLFLIENGCRAFQGFLFGRPLPLQQFEQSVIQSGQTEGVVR